VSDDGPGFPTQILARLGEPYISDRAGARRGEDEAAGGLGLGLFIAKALLERAGARLTIANAVAPNRGALVTIVWPFAAFVQAKRSPRT
jgi:two-component system sensor histidine kinase RegB